VFAGMLLAAVSGCEKEIGDGSPCCSISTLRGCCWNEPLESGGWFSTDPSICGGPTRAPIPACSLFPASERFETRGCLTLFQDTTAEPCDCTPPEDGCEPVCDVPEPPSLPDACADTAVESDNPATCPATGTVITYRVTKIAADPYASSGFDLDRVEGSSCVEGPLARPDAAGGVDNSLASLDTRALDRELLNQICGGLLTLSFQVEANPEEACARVTVLNGDQEVTFAALNLSAACLSGELEQFVLPLADGPVVLENVILTATLDGMGISNWILGAIANESASQRIFVDILREPTAFDSYFDIRTDLDATGELQCDATSLTLQLGGVAQ